MFKIHFQPLPDLFCETTWGLPWMQGLPCPPDFSESDTNTQVVDGAKQNETEQGSDAESASSGLAMTIQKFSGKI